MTYSPDTPKITDGWACEDFLKLREAAQEVGLEDDLLSSLGFRIDQGSEHGMPDVLAVIVSSLGNRDVQKIWWLR